MVTVYFNEVKIVDANGSVGSENKAAGNVVSAPTSYYFGANNDLWSESWSAANINDSDFGVVVAFQAGGAGAISHYLKATNFGFSIPGDATIDGILVEINAAYYQVFGPKGGARCNYVKITVYYTEVAGTTRQVKISGTFEEKPYQIKIAGTFVDKPALVKVGGTFQ